MNFTKNLPNLPEFTQFSGQIFGIIPTPHFLSLISKSLTNPIWSHTLEYRLYTTVLFVAIAAVPRRVSGIQQVISKWVNHLIMSSNKRKRIRNRRTINVCVCFFKWPIPQKVSGSPNTWRSSPLPPLEVFSSVFIYYSGCQQGAVCFWGDMWWCINIFSCHNWGRYLIDHL